MEHRLNFQYSRGVRLGIEKIEGGWSLSMPGQLVYDEAEALPGAWLLARTF